MATENYNPENRIPKVPDTATGRGNSTPGTNGSANNGGSYQPGQPPYHHPYSNGQNPYCQGSYNPGNYRQAPQYQAPYPYSQPANPYMPYQEKQESNPLGTTGFVLAIISIVIGWVPYIGWLIWLLALIFSAIGISRRPRALATAGLIITVGMLIVLVIVIASLGVAVLTEIGDSY